MKIPALILFILLVVACSHNSDKALSEKYFRLALDTVNFSSSHLESHDSINAERLAIAISFLEKSIRLDSLNNHPYYWKSQFLLEKRKYDEAIVAADKGIKVTSNKKDSFYANFLIQRGIIRYKLGQEKSYKDFEYALNVYQELLKNDKEEPNYVLNKALILCYLNRKTEALEFLHVYLSDDKENEELKEIKEFINEFDAKSTLEKY